MYAFVKGSFLAQRLMSCINNAIDDSTNRGSCQQRQPASQRCEPDCHHPMRSKASGRRATHVQRRTALATWHTVLQLSVQHHWCTSPAGLVHITALALDVTNLAHLGRRDSLVPVAVTVSVYLSASYVQRLETCREYHAFSKSFSFFLTLYS